MKEILNVNAQAVLNVVRSLHNHPTALEVYEAVKQQRSSEVSGFVVGMSGDAE